MKDSYISNEAVSFLAGRELLQVCIGRDQLQLRFDEDVVISIEGIVMMDGVLVDDYLNDAFRIVRLIGAHVTQANTCGSSDLALRFSSGDDVTIRNSHENYESYSIYAPGIDLVV